MISRILQACAGVGFLAQIPATLFVLPQYEVDSALPQSRGYNRARNYLYSLLEAETRLSLAKLGLDPSLGFIHVDTPARDSLACDLMEVGRPAIDTYVLRLLQQPLRRDWFF